MKSCKCLACKNGYLDECLTETYPEDNVEEDNKELFSSGELFFYSKHRTLDIHPPNRGDVGIDLKSAIDCVIPAKGFVKIPTGVHIEYRGFDDLYDHNIYAQVFARSGLSSKGLFISGGVIDASYRGEISVVMFNFTDENYQVKFGDKIAQMVLLWYVDDPTYNITKVTSLDDLTPTERGSDGFGSTGV